MKQSTPSNQTPNRLLASVAKGDWGLVFRWRLMIAAWCLLTGCISSFGQPLPKKVSNFNVAPEYYPGPHQAQMKSLLQAAEAEPQGDGRLVELKELKLQTFREDGTKELLVQAPQCTYDSREHLANSPGRLRVESGDGKFSIEGVGFVWRQTNSSLIISNQVHTQVQPELLETRTEGKKGEPKAGAEASTPASSPKASPTEAFGKSGLDLWSDRFSYEGQSGLASYQENVRAAGTNFSMSSGLLTLVLPMAERRLESMTAEQDVLIDSSEIHATGQKVRYSMATDIVELFGQPQWRAGQQAGSGDQITIERTNKIFRANGHAVLKLSGQSAGAGSFLPGNPLLETNAPKTTNAVVEILCDNYELRTNLAFFRKDVRVTQRVEEQPKGKMSCAVLNVTFVGTNQLESLTAETNVIFEQDDNQFTAARAVYTGTNDIMELTGSPAWKASAREGKGDVIQVNVGKNEMRVDGNAYMRLPAEEVGGDAIQVGQKKPLTPALSPSDRERGTKPAGDSPTPEQKPQQFADVFCQRYTVSPGGANFDGNVRLEHPQMHWTCDTVNAEFASAQGKSGKMIAERNVVFDLHEEKGGAVHGTSDKAVYTFGVTENQTNNFVELTGTPILQTTNGTIQNAIIILDVSAHTLALPGNFRIVGTGPLATNLFIK